MATSVPGTTFPYRPRNVLFIGPVIAAFAVALVLGVATYRSRPRS